MTDAQTAREVQALPGPAEAEVRAASVGTTATLTEALRQWAQGQPRRGTVPAEGAAAAAALGEQVGPILALHLPRAEALATAHVGRQLGAVTDVVPTTPDTAAIGEHLAGRAREILAAELGRAYLCGLERFDPGVVAQTVVRRVVAAAVLAVRTELMRAYNATARALHDAVGRRRRWDAQLDTACARCVALDGRIAEPGQPFALEGAPIADPPLHPHCRCVLVPARPAIRGVSTRHTIRGINANSRVTAENTILLPVVDERADVRAINEGRAVEGRVPSGGPMAGQVTFTVNGRTYILEPGSANALIPQSGEGVVPMRRGAYKALIELIDGANNSRPASSAEILPRDPSITQDDREKAWDVWLEAGRPRR